MLNVEKIFILHYTKLVERKKRLDAMLSHFNIEAEYFLDYDQEDLTPQIIEEYYKPDETEYERKINDLYGSRAAPYRELNIAQISCTIKHYNCIKKVAEETKEYGLVLEDDVIFVEGFVEKFNLFLQETPSDWDAIFLGCCAGLRVPSIFLKEGVCAYRMEDPASRGGDSYLLKTSAAQKIISTMKPFTTISDWELAAQLHQHNLKTYWWEPPLVVQGSENGLYKTTLNDDHHRETIGGQT